MELTIKNRKIIKQGQSRLFYLPSAYFDNEQLDENQIYDIKILIPSKNKKSNLESEKKNGQ